MPSNERSGRRLPAWTSRDSTKVRLDLGIYVGVIKNNLDPARTGRLQVWIPELGGKEADSQSWRTVNYASPFFGSTTIDGTENKWDQSPHTYGFWAVPPDLDNQVLCLFVNGDPDRGYWFACVPNTASHNMVPGIGRGVRYDKTGVDPALAPSIVDGSAIPVTEFNDENPNITIDENFYYNAKPVHQPQYKTVLQQGLDKDPLRGIVGSSSQRESPSTVFGISTPGRFSKDPADDPNFINKLESGDLTETDLPKGPRKGGHTLVMDDGDLLGDDNHIRLRSAGGHQILMSDTGKIMYIGNSSGSVWMEFADNGQVHVYSGGGLNIRTEGDMNLHSDKNINMFAKNIVNIASGQKLNLQTNTLNLRSFGASTIYGAGVNIGSSGDLNLSADNTGNFKAGGQLFCVGSKVMLNSGGGVSVKAPAKVPNYVHNDTGRSDANSSWKQTSNATDSACTILPAHEPWTRQTGVDQLTGVPAPTGSGDAIDGVNKPTRVDGSGPPTKNFGEINCTPRGPVVKDSSGNVVKDGNGNPVRSSASESDPGPAAAAKKGVDNPVPAEWLSRPDAPNPPGGIGPLSQHQVKCIMTQMAYSESRFAYDIREKTNGNYLGRYQIGAGALVETGYMNVEYFRKYNTSAVRYPDAWTGQDNVKSDADFLANKAVQEKVMYALMQKNYNYLLSKSDGKRGIDPDNDDLCTIAGMLCVAQLLGAGGARKWRFTASGADANGSTGDIYYNRGRYAIDILATGGQTSQGRNGAGPTVVTDKNGLTPAAREAASANINPDDVIQFTNEGTRTGTKEKFLQCDENFRYMVLGFAREFKQKSGQKLICVSSLRTQEDQQKLYDAWVQAGGSKSNPKVYTKQYGWLFVPVPRVGYHGTGLAIDVPVEQMQLANKFGLHDKYGLQWGISFNDPPHMQYPRKR